MSGGTVSDLNHTDLIKLIGNRCHTKAGLAIHGTNTENVLTTAAVVYSIAGVMYTAAADTEVDISALTNTVDVPATAEGETISLSAGKAAVFALCYDAAGTQSLVKGREATTVALAKMPVVPATLCPTGLIKVLNEAATAWVPGTTDLDATSVTSTYFDIAVLP